MLDTRGRRPARGPRGRRRRSSRRSSSRTSFRRSASSPASPRSRRDYVDGARARSSTGCATAERPRALRRPRRLAAAVGRARAASSGTTRACRASAPARWPSSSRRRSACRPRRSPTNGRATRSRSHRTPREAGTRAQPARRGGGLVRRGQATHRATRKSSSPRTIKRVKVCRMETVCKLRYMEGHARRARVQNLVAPLRYERRDHRRCPRRSSTQIRQALDNLQRQAERGGHVHRLHRRRRRSTGRNERIYGDHVRCRRRGRTGSRWRSRKRSACRPPRSQSDGRGADAAARRPTRPRRGGAEPSHRGGVLVRRSAAGAAGRAAAVPGRRRRRDGDARSTTRPGAASRRCSSSTASRGSAGLRDGPASRAGGRRRTEPTRACASSATRSNERLDRRTALVYGDDIGLSAARARRAMDTVAAGLGTRRRAGRVRRPRLRAVRRRRQCRLHPGRDFVRRRPGRVRRARAPLDDYEGVDITRMTRELKPEESVRAQPDAHHRRRRADRRSGAQLGRRPALHRRRARRGRHPVPASTTSSRARASASRRIRRPCCDATAATDRSRRRCGSGCTRTTPHFIERAEVRIFEREQSLRGGAARDRRQSTGRAWREWQPAAEPSRVRRAS